MVDEVVGIGLEATGDVAVEEIVDVTEEGVLEDEIGTVGGSKEALLGGPVADAVDWTGRVPPIGIGVGLKKTVSSDENVVDAPASATSSHSASEPLIVQPTPAVRASAGISAVSEMIVEPCTSVTGRAGLEVKVMERNTNALVKGMVPVNPSRTYVVPSGPVPCAMPVS